MADNKDQEQDFPHMDPYDDFYTDPDMFFNFNHHPYMSVNIPDFKHQGKQDVTYPIDVEATKLKVVENLQQVFDPEIPINIYDLGLVYSVEVRDSGSCHVVMTLTTPNCPSAQELPEVARMAISAVPEISVAQLDLTFDPPWDPSQMNEDAKLMMLAEYGMDMGGNQ